LDLDFKNLNPFAASTRGENRFINLRFINHSQIIMPSAMMITVQEGQSALRQDFAFYGGAELGSKLEVLPGAV